jgi:hypothetical protein
MLSNCHVALCVLFFWVLGFSSAIVQKELGRRDFDGYYSRSCTTQSISLLLTALQ